MSGFEVKNPQIEDLLKRVAGVIKKMTPPGWGFTVMLFDTDTTKGSMFYLSSARREDMINAMKEFIEKNDK